MISGGPVRAVAFTQTVAGLPDTTFLVMSASPPDADNPSCDAASRRRRVSFHEGRPMLKFLMTVGVIFW
jgi:hypothetical protein